MLRVAILVEMSTSWGTGVVQGITRYADEQGPWSFFVEPRGRYEFLSLPKNWNGHGVIARVNHSGLAERLRRTQIPAVNVSWFDCGNSIPRVSTDEYWTGQLAAEHLIDLGLSSFGYCGPFDRLGYTDQILAGFLEHLHREGFECDLFPDKYRRIKQWDSRRKRLGAWLTQLPKPSGVLVWNDVSGRLIAEACSYEGLRVPEDVALMTGEYDEMSNQMSATPLTSVDHVAESVGYEAARVLDTMMHGASAPSNAVLLRNAHIVHRRSTDIAAVADPQLAEAISLMRQRACEGINVSELLRELPISRRVLEQGCRDTIGRSPGEELRRMRIERAKHLLATTSLQLSKIASLCGFRDRDALGRRFRSSVGQSPSEYRAECRRI